MAPSAPKALVEYIFVRERLVLTEVCHGGARRSNGRTTRHLSRAARRGPNARSTGGHGAPIELNPPREGGRHDGRAIEGAAALHDDRRAFEGGGGGGGAAPSYVPRRAGGRGVRGGDRHTNGTARWPRG